MLNLPKNKKYILACSYGPDSMALFDMLIKEGYSFVVAHVNYGLREECFKETEDLEKYCKRNNIPLYIKRVKTWENKSNLEGKCREIRYSFFSELVSKTGIDTVLVAHNQDDVIETYLLQKRRKSFVKYFGISKEMEMKGYKVIRPLLHLKKEYLENYCKNNSVPYAIDSSNLDDAFERNKIRHGIVSKLSDQERENYISKIVEENNNLKCLFGYLKDNDIHSNDFLLSLNFQDFSYAINELCHEAKSDYSLSKKFVYEILKTLKSSKPNVVFPFAKKLQFVKTYGRCYFEVAEDIDFSYVVNGPCTLDNEYFYLSLNSDTSNMHLSNNDYPITIRVARTTDIYEVNGYQVTARRLFIDWKLPLNLRKRWPVIINKDGKVIFIPRYRPDFVTNPSLNVYVKQ